MYYGQKISPRELLVQAQRRLPAGQRLVQEAFTSEHRRPVLVKLSELHPDTFYLFDEITAQALRDSVVELAARDGGERLTVSHSFFGELQAQQHRLQRVAARVHRIRVLAAGQPGAGISTERGIDFYNIAGSPLARYGIALKEGARPLLFISREQQRLKISDNPRSLGFFSVNEDTVEEIADDIELLLRGLATGLTAFERLELLHQTTQRVARELESYSRRMELAVRRARRRPDLLTPARFDRILGQAIAKMEQLKEIPRRALRSIGKSAR